MLLKPFDRLVVGVDTIRVCLGWIALNVEVVVGSGEDSERFLAPALSSAACDSGREQSVRRSFETATFCLVSISSNSSG